MPHAQPAPITHWQVGPARRLRLDRACIMGILNVTPDSFSDGGRFTSAEDVADAARRLVEEGADMLDVGGESTRPGAERIDADEQIRRVVPAISAIRARGVDVPISVDTTRASVARAALDAGADAINDVSGAQEDDAMLALAAQRGAGLILMHRLRPPDADAYSHSYTTDPEYEGGVVAAVVDYLSARARAAQKAGVDRAAIALDPGLGFGKTVDQNYLLIARGAAISALGFPVLAAASRKSFIGVASGVETSSERLSGSIAASVAQRLGGANIFRVHDVGSQAEAIRVADRIVRAMSPTRDDPQD